MKDVNDNKTIDMFDGDIERFISVMHDINTKKEELDSKFKELISEEMKFKGYKVTKIFFRFGRKWSFFLDDAHWGCKFVSQDDSVVYGDYLVECPVSGEISIYKIKNKAGK